MKKIILTFITSALMTIGTVAQNVNIPGTNFKDFLLANTFINTNNDTEIQITEAEAFSGSISCSNLNISDLTGIEAFVNLVTLDCSQNNLTALDLSQNTVLRILKCGLNDLGSLDLSNNPALSYLDCSVSGLSTLDVSHNTQLTSITCSGNSLATLDLSNNTKLIYLYCNKNDLTMLNITQCKDLDALDCTNNKFTNLDLSSNTSLTNISCYQNDLTTLNMSQNVLLSNISCSNNKLEALDLSTNTSLLYLQCHSNNLTELDLSNNTALQLLECYNNPFLTVLNLKNVDPTQNAYFKADNNQSLTCITVDDVELATSIWTEIDASTNFSLHCGVVGIDKTFLPNLSIFPNPAHSQLTIETDARIKSVTVINLTGEKKTIFTTNGSIDVSDLEEGVYFLQTEINGVLVSDKFTKE